MAKTGYISLLVRSPKSKYDKSLFKARNAVNAAGVFDPLLDRISEGMQERIVSQTGSIKMLDAGCGEGSHLSRILNRLAGQAPAIDWLGVGVDLSKEGIRLAVRENVQAIWCAADLARCPFADKQFDFVLSICSPSNYAEFGRMLADEGTVIKAVPASGYLRELRELLYRETARQDYSNERVVERFGRYFDLIDTERVTYKAAMDPLLLEQIVQMTPLAWGAPQELVREATAERFAEITFDFDIMYGKQPRRDQ
nr:methyltransferase domain-containing protein [Paenibacillus sp. UNCCL117]